MSFRSLVFVPLFTTLALISGYATASSNDGSVADAVLQRDVMRMISFYESTMGVSKQPTLVFAQGTGKVGSTYVERWTVDSNGTNVVYQVKLTSSPGGGVDFVVTRLGKQ